MQVFHECGGDDITKQRGVNTATTPYRLRPLHFYFPLITIIDLTPKPNIHFSLLVLESTTESQYNGSGAVVAGPGRLWTPGNRHRLARRHTTAPSWRSGSLCQGCLHSQRRVRSIIESRDQTVCPDSFSRLRKAEIIPTGQFVQGHIWAWAASSLTPLRLSH